jgi:mannonate dehydratase
MLPLVANRWIDFIRIHVSAIGCLRLARKIACCCEMFGVPTAWHGPAMSHRLGTRSICIWIVRPRSSLMRLR